MIKSPFGSLNECANMAYKAGWVNITPLRKGRCDESNYLNES